jgi:hypothetical protein
MQVKGENLVSIYLPTYQKGPEIQQNKIRFKNLLSGAENQLLERGVSKNSIAEYNKKVKALLRNSQFWNHQSAGLAAFISQDDYQIYKVPLDFEDIVIVSDRFYLKPLLPLLTKNNHFFILALSLGGVKLLEATRFHFNEFDLIDVPQNLNDALRYDDPEKQLQHQTLTRTGSGQPAIFHGHSVGTDDAEKKKNILRYFQKVDHGIRNHIRDSNHPLIIAAIDYLHPIYEEANKYPHLMKEGITKNPETLSNKELHAKAWRIIESLVMTEQMNAIEKFSALMDTEYTSLHIDEIIKAAHEGRIDTLFIEKDSVQWGSFDETEYVIETHMVRKPESRDLLEFAAIQTTLNGGVVYVIESNFLPTNHLAAAILRF